MQKEAIAQARALAQLNAAGLYGESAAGGISANAQWEVAYSRPAGATKGGRPDILLYKRHDTSGSLELVEVKVRWDSNSQTAASNQLQDYVRDLPKGAANRAVIPHAFSPAHRDEFRVKIQDCDTADKRVVEQYDVRSVNAPGILMVYGPDREITDCPDPGDPPLPPLQAEKPKTTDVDEDAGNEDIPIMVPPPGTSSDGNGKDDHWEDHIDRHPELEPLRPFIPAAPEREAPIKVPMSVQAGAVLLAVGAACVLAGPACTGYLASAAAVVGGRIAIAAAARAYGSLMGALVGYRLYGDPHLATLDGFGYDLQSVGEFHLLEIPDAGIDVQARFAPAGPNASQTQWIATEINDDRIEIGPAGIRINGAPVTLAEGEVYPLYDGASLANSGPAYVLTWPGSDLRPVMIYNSLNGGAAGFLIPPGNPAGSVRGLLGNHDGDPGNDLALRDGTPLPANTNQVTLHTSYADSWRVSDEESAFTYGAGESTATFTDEDFPTNILNVSNLPADDVESAHYVCAIAGVAPGPQFEDCVFDVALTGDSAYADTAALVTDVLVDATAKSFNAAGHLEVDFEGTVPSNFVSPKYRQDAATTRMAGPLFDTPGYRLFVRDIGRHDGLDLDADLYAFGPVASDSRAQSVTLRVNKTDRGQVLFDGGAPRLSEGMAGTLTAAGSGTLANGEHYARYRLHSPLGRVGEALDVELVPENFKGAFTTSLGVDDIELNLDVPPAQRFDVTEPVSVGDPAIPGPGEGSGRLESPGAADFYDFEVPSDQAGESHVIKTRDCTTQLTYTLTDRASGAQVGRWPEACATTWTTLTTPPLSAGQYRLSASSYASKAAGTYSFDLDVLPAPQHYPYVLQQVVHNGAPAAGAGNLETASSQDVYGFDAPGGRLYLDIRGTCPNGLHWRLTSPAGQWAEGACEDRYIGPLPAGAYELTVYSVSRGGGAYGFQLFAVPLPIHDFAMPSLPFTVADQVPAPGAGNLETSLSFDRYTFTVTDPAPLYLDWQTCPTGNGGLRWRLFDENGEEVGDGGTCTDQRTADLPAGDYRLAVLSNGEAIGAYALQAWLEPLAPQTFAVSVPATIAPNQPAAGAGNLETKASQDVYEFTLAEDQSSLYLADIDCSTPGMLSWELVSDALAPTVSTGGTVVIDSGGCDDKQIRRIGHGQYRLIVSAAGEHHGSYGLRILPSKTGTPTIVHTPQVTAYYGQPIPIEASTTCAEAEHCFARVYYRTSKTTGGLSAGAWTRRDLTSTGTTTTGGQTLVKWAGQVPAAVVTTTGLDYYLTAGDGSNRNELPVAPPIHPALTASGDPASSGLDAETTYLHVTTVSPPLLTHLSPIYAHADNPLPLELRATCSTGNCTATLHYRTSTNATVNDLTADPGWPSITMAQSASTNLGDAGKLLTYTATIPGNKVDTRGLDYYFEVTDTHTTSYWPGTTYQGYYAPTDGMRTAYQQIHVLEPPHVVHVPVATTAYQAATPITATANCPATRTCTARLYYRTTTNTGDPIADGPAGEVLNGDKDFASAPMTVTRLPGLAGTDVITVTGSIPASFADTRGIDYFFRVDDGSTTTWFPGTGQVQGYVNIDGARVAYHHVRVLDPPHITHLPDPQTKALKAYTVTARMTCVTEDCAMTLHWRNDLAPGEENPGWHALQMTRSGAPVPTPLGAQYTYTATIPAEKVTTRGLAYWLEGFDGHTHDYSPGTSYWGAYLPMDGQPVNSSVAAGENTAVVGAYLVRVLEPPHLIHAPPGVVAKGEPLTLTANSNCSSPTCEATLSWTDAAGNKRTVTMTGVKDLEGAAVNPAVPGDAWSYTATIPAADTTTTVRYSIKVTDGYTTDSTLPMQALVYEPAS